MSMATLVTGGSGFIGGWLINRLLERGDAVTILDRGITDTSPIPAGADHHTIDLTDMAAARELKLPDIDVLYHIGGPSSGMASTDDPLGTLNTTYAIGLTAIELAERLHAKRIVYASSMAVYGDPADPMQPVREDMPLRPKSHYAIAKIAAENMIAAAASAAGIAYNHLRLFNVYGPGQDLNRTDQGIVSIFLAQLLASPHAVSKGSLERFRDLVHVGDVVAAMTACVDAEAVSGAYNVGSGTRTTVGELITIIARELGIEDKLEITAEADRPDDIIGIWGDIDKIKAAAGYRVEYDAHKGVEDFIQAVTRNGSA